MLWSNKKVNLKFFSAHVTESHTDSWGTPAKARSVATRCPGPLTPGEGSNYSLNKKLGGPHMWAGQFGEEENFLPPPGFEPRIISPWLVWNSSVT